MKIINISQNGKKVFFAVIFSFIISITFAQDPPPPPGGGGTEDTRDGTNQLGGGAPVGEGILLLLAMGAAYSGRKIYKNNLINEKN